MADTEQRQVTEGEGGLHRDGDKPRLSDIFYWPLLLAAGDVWTRNNRPTEDYLEGKYPDVNGKPNYQSGIQTTKLLDSCQRHLAALHQGIDVDEESGLDHAAHLLCCLSMFAYMREHKPGLDNRTKPAKRRDPPVEGMRFVMTTKTASGKDLLRILHCPHCDVGVTLDTADMPFTHWCLECGEPFRAVAGYRQ